MASPLFEFTPAITKEQRFTMEDDRDFIPDQTLMREFYTHKTSYWLVRRNPTTNQIIEVGQGEGSKDNVATAAMWLKFGNNVHAGSREGAREVYEICAHRGIRLMGAST